jgi:adenylate cyclase
LDVLINTFVIIITILFWAFLLLLILNAKSWSDIIPYLRLFFNSQGVAIGVTYGIIVSFLFNLFISVQEIIGSRTMAALFLGIYSQPREEKRIFMFLDIKSSTTLAEQLGNKQFLNMLNDFFFFASEGISQTKGSIYKYVGDEIIISWPEKKGVKNGNALRCFFMIDEAINRKKSYFLKKYGVVPEFKAGMHAGQVVAGEIGFKKKEITFLGHVLNTTARIEGICNEFNKRFLLSSEVKELFENTAAYDFQEMAEIYLRGKKHKTSIFTVTKSGC